MNAAGMGPAGVRHGVALPTGWLAARSTLPEVAAGIEGLGFDSVWLSELESDPAPARDALATCSAIGVVTSRIGLVALLDPDARIPAVAAKAASGTDRLCGGRLTLGLFEGSGIDQIRATLDGKGPPNLPAPAGPVPLWVVGEGSAMVANSAAGWFLGWNHGLDEVVQAVRRLEEECDAQGRDPRSIGVAVGSTAIVGAGSDEAAAHWTVDEAQQWVADMAGSGVTDLVLSFAPRPFGWEDESPAETWAKEVLGPSITDGGYAGGERSRR